MKTNLLHIFLLIAFLTLTGCTETQSLVSNQPKFTAPQNQAPASARFQDPSQENTAVDSAVKLAQKHAQLSQENNLLELKIQNLTAENQKLKKEVETLTPQLKQAKTELQQANDILIDMTTELNNWKMQVLGFQDEMRNADKAQMEIMLKIAKAMGAEIEPDPQIAKSEKLTTEESNE